MNDREIVCPIALKHTDQVFCVPRWYLDGSENGVVPATYQALINGQEAFEAVHRAIAQATKSIDIICWGFQPSMYFIRDGRAPCIGELLMEKARQGVKVRVLGWEFPLNLAGLAGEGNLPGKGALRWGDQALQSTTKAQYEFDQHWFKTCAIDDNQAIERAASGLPLFVSRGFSRIERNAINKDLEQHALDSEVAKMTRLVQWLSPSHHQKSVLVDYELPERATGFVMGHNMLDEYWDTHAHSALNRTPQTKPAPNRGARGFKPRQDISCQLSGPILHYVHLNFANAWSKETGETLMSPDAAQAIAAQLRPRGQPQMAQLLRTQSQLGVRDIEKAYLNAVNNATDFIYIENQYFRWPPLAEAIKRTAEQLTRAGRDPGVHGSLHLFVVTNDTADGMGAGTVNTQRMLESLGRADTIPEVTKLRRIEQYKKTEPRRPRPEPRDLAGQKALMEWQLEHNRNIQEITNSSVLPDRNIPGLKVHVCSLVAPDSPAGHPWTPVYIHSKLMIVDDVYTIQGSANINTRSMQVDTELNIAHEWRSVTQALRRRLWGMHTGGMGDQDDSSKAFERWTKIIKENTKKRRAMSAPTVALVEFYFDSPIISDID